MLAVCQLECVVLATGHHCRANELVLSDWLVLRECFGREGGGDSSGGGKGGEFLLKVEVILDHHHVAELGQDLDGGKQAEQVSGVVR